MFSVVLLTWNLALKLCELDTLCTNPDKQAASKLDVSVGRSQVDRQVRTGLRVTARSAFRRRPGTHLFPFTVLVKATCVCPPNMQVQPDKSGDQSRPRIIQVALLLALGDRYNWLLFVGKLPVKGRPNHRWRFVCNSGGCIAVQCSIIRV